MATIGIIGANGQVGTEVCLLLKCMGERPVAICRSELATAFLRRCGVECRVGKFRTPEEVSTMLAGCDVVADFSLIRGAASEMRSIIASLVALVTRHAPKSARYVYISSEMAYGMRQETLRFQSHRISRTLYGASKRFGEALAFKLGRAAGREVFALRLGQVHGELQNESARILSELRAGPAIVPDTASDSVFAFTVAEALIHIANGKEQPGTYTLVSEPQWRWKEVYEYYARQAGIEPEALPVPADRYSPPTPRGVRALRGTVMSSALSKATLFRESISAYALWRRPAWERRLASSYRRKNASRDIAALESRLEYRPCDARLGDVLGARLQSLSDSRTSMAKTISQVRTMLDQAAPPRREVHRQADILKVKNS